MAMYYWYNLTGSATACKLEALAYCVASYTLALSVYISNGGINNQEMENSRYRILAFNVNIKHTAAARVSDSISMQSML
jgi:hypothetical protein